jgi:hypothetical protein
VLKGLEAGTRRLLGYVGLFLLLTFVSGIAIGIANSNLFWGEANQYGRVDIPGHKVIHLPAGKIQVNAAAAVPGRGNATPTFLLPKLSLSVEPVEGNADVVFDKSVGYSENADDKYDDTQRRVWYLHVSQAGDYKVTAGGDFTGYGVNAELWFGYEPGLVRGWNIWLVALAVAAIGEALYAAFDFWRVRRKGGRDGTSGYQEGSDLGLPTSTWVPPA